jgi:hypothetical protein
MSGQSGGSQQRGGTGVLDAAWRKKSWWLPAVLILLVLIGIVYVLGHLSSTDSEMYPTSKQIETGYHRSC